MLEIAAIRTEELADVKANVDLFFCACGYESRSTYVASEVAIRSSRRVALGFGAQQELRYDANRAWFLSNGFELHDVSDDAFESKVEQLSGELSRVSEPAAIIDISCLNRARLARLVRTLQSASCESLDLSFAYNLAAYSPPMEEIGPTRVAEPVIPEFAGWTNAPEKPPAAVLGLGYEQSRAIGIVDHLEINNAAWAFIPRGPIEKYSESVDAANASLFRLISQEGRQIPYDVMDPASLFREINALVDLLKHMFNPLLIPFGPKIFALVSLLVACMHEEVGVWRVSSGALGAAVDRRPSEFTTVLRTKWLPKSRDAR